ncbi:peptidase [Fragilaria crotonensis]|nr:peptidase [Fragilaria crotonensis]
MKLQALITLLLLCTRLSISADLFESESEPGEMKNYSSRFLGGRKRRKPSGPKASTRIRTSSRIVGGSPAGAETYPFMVALYSADDPSTSLPVCGGSLITPNVVLTAAHCIMEIKTAQIGRYDIVLDEPGVQTYVASERRMHPTFDRRTYDFDYALLKLDRPHPNPYMVSLRTTPEIPNLLTIIGWGATSDGGSQSTKLLAADVRRFNTTKCRRNYNPDPITKNMFCAEKKGVDACQGDSGGPIVINGSNIQVGITSWGSGCANATYPGVYARVDKGYSWIEKTVCSDLSPGDCEKDGRLPLVSNEGSAQMRTCEEQDTFIGLGKKRSVRNCAWVKENAIQRCLWYEDFCPLTCGVDRCKN